MEQVAIVKYLLMLSIFRRKQKIMYHPLLGVDLIKNVVIIGPESDHWLTLSVTN